MLPLVRALKEFRVVVGLSGGYWPYHHKRLARGLNLVKLAARLLPASAEESRRLSLVGLSISLMGSAIAV
jgi:hypothetical protein